MTIQASYVRSLFANLENGRTDAFFDHVAEDVDWTVMGTHPLAGTYHTKADFLVHTFGRLNKLLKEGVVLRVTNLLVDGDNRGGGTGVAFQSVERKALRQQVLLGSPLLERNHRGGQGLLGLGTRTTVDRRKRAPTLYGVFC